MKLIMRLLFANICATFLLFGCVEFDKSIAPDSSACDPRLIGAWYKVSETNEFVFLHIYQSTAKHFDYVLVTHPVRVGDRGSAAPGNLCTFLTKGRLFVAISALPEYDVGYQHGPIYRVDFDTNATSFVLFEPRDDSYLKAVDDQVLEGVVNVRNQGHSPIRMKISSPRNDVVNWLGDLPDKEFDKIGEFKRLEIDRTSEERAHCATKAQSEGKP